MRKLIKTLKMKAHAQAKVLFEEYGIRTPLCFENMAPEHRLSFLLGKVAALEELEKEAKQS